LLQRHAYALLLPVGEGQDEGIKKKEFLFSTLTLALSRWEREFRPALCPTSKFVPNSIVSRCERE